MEKNDEIKSRKKCNKQKKETSLILQSLIQITLYKQDSPMKSVINYTHFNQKGSLAFNPATIFGLRSFL